MSFLSPAFKSYMQLRQSAIDNFMLNPINTQTQVFNDLVGSGQFTEFGKKYKMEDINDIQDFKHQVPIQDYESLKPYIQKILKGDQNILWNSPINWFAKSSGTTSDRSKFIPISQEILDENHYRAGKDVLSLYLRLRPQSDLLKGKCLAIGGSHQVNQLNADSFYGDLSAVTLQNMPFIGQQLHALDLSVALMDSWEEKMEKMAQTSISENVTFIAGVPTWTLLLGKRILEITEKSTLKEVWPDLELYIHGGVSFTPYKNQFEELFGDPNIQFLETYNASEGFFAAQNDLNEEGLLLFLNHGIFYEFLPLEEIHQDYPRTLQLKEVEKGVNYALVISTQGGLWRYLIGDTIQFTSLNPFKIKVTGRTKSFINAFGEEVMVANSDAAIAIASEITGAQVADYTAAPIYLNTNQKGGHEWIIEFNRCPDSLEQFTIALDQALQSVNSDYAAKRRGDIALGLPLIHLMPKGGFNNWLKEKGKLGGQHKVPRLNNNREIMEDILLFIHHTSSKIA